MRKPLRIQKTWLIALAITIVALGTVVSTLVFATGDSRLTVEGYSDVVRFEAAGVATLQVTIYDLSGKKVWDSGMVAGSTVDWDRNNERGERMAYGAYLYVAQGWEAGGELSFKKNGKLALMPGDKVQLQQAPVVQGTMEPNAEPPTAEQDRMVRTLTQTVDDDLIVKGTITSERSGSSDNNVIVLSGPTGDRAGFRFHGFARGATPDKALFQLRTDRPDAVFSVYEGQSGTWKGAWRFFYLAERFDFYGNQVDNVGKLGVGTSGTDVTAKLTIQGTSGDLIAAYNSSNRVFCSVCGRFQYRKCRCSRAHQRE